MRSSATPLVVTGMHHSGTSLVASLLAPGAAGRGDGARLPRVLATDGRREDAELAQLQRSLIAACVGPSTEAPPDWGWSDLGLWDDAPLRDHVEVARGIVWRRRQSGRLWGWED